MFSIITGLFSTNNHSTQPKGKELTDQAILDIIELLKNKPLPFADLESTYKTSYYSVTTYLKLKNGLAKRLVTENRILKLTDEDIRDIIEFLMIQDYPFADLQSTYRTPPFTGDDYKKIKDGLTQRLAT